MSEIVLPDKETIEQYVVSALREIDLLNNHPETHHWSISMPYRDDDSDVIISNAVHCVKPLLTRVENLQAELVGTRARAMQAANQRDALQVDLAAALARAEQAEERVKELSSRMAVLLQWEDSVKVIKGIPYPKTLEINIDWIVKHYEQSPIATGMVLGDLLDLFEERLGELTA